MTTENDKRLVTLVEFLDFVGGRASDDTKDRIREALVDPESNVTKWVLDIERWARHEFTVKLQQANDTSLPNSIGHSVSVTEVGQGGKRLLQLVRVVRQQYAIGKLTHDDIQSIYSVARSIGLDPERPNECDKPVLQWAAVNAMMAAIKQKNPLLAAEILLPDSLER